MLARVDPQPPMMLTMTDEESSGLRIMLALSDPSDSVFAAMWHRANGNNVPPAAYSAALLAARAWLARACYLGQQGRLLLQPLGMEAGPDGGALPEDSLAEKVMALRRDGVPMREVGHRLGISKATVYWISRARVGRLRRANLSETEHQGIRAALLLGEQPKVIAERYTVSISVVYHEKSAMIEAGRLPRRGAGLTASST